MGKLENINIISRTLLPTPADVKGRVPLQPGVAEKIVAHRQSINDILDRKDRRIFVVMGPCSIHDTKAAREYAEKLLALGEEVKETMILVMRVYFEKPRTTVGWKGFINDPYLDDSFRIDEGLFKARELLTWMGDLGLAVGTEALDPVTPQYFNDLITWTAIGARTTESQTHRELASGLSTPVGFKNGTDGSVEIAVNAMKSASHSHHFLGIDQNGRCAVFHTRGNQYGHLVLRGGKEPNYDAENVARAERALDSAGLPVNIMIDCSHGNSLKDPTKQPIVFADCIQQIVQGNKSIVGAMIESNLQFGNQSIPEDRSKLKYGVSVTDACIDWQTTQKIILEADRKLR